MSSVASKTITESGSVRPSGQLPGGTTILMKLEKLARLHTDRAEVAKAWDGVLGRVVELKPRQALDGDVFAVREVPDVGEVRVRDDAGGEVEEVVGRAAGVHARRLRVNREPTLASALHRQAVGPAEGFRAGRTLELDGRAEGHGGGWDRVGPARGGGRERVRRVGLGERLADDGDALGGGELAAGETEVGELLAAARAGHH
eukprot:3557619-Rhodomonas_salina.1